MKTRNALFGLAALLGIGMGGEALAVECSSHGARPTGEEIATAKVVTDFPQRCGGYVGHIIDFRYDPGNCSWVVLDHNCTSRTSTRRRTPRIDPCEDYCFPATVAKAAGMDITRYTQKSCRKGDICIPNLPDLTQHEPETVDVPAPAAPVDTIPRARQSDLESLARKVRELEQRPLPAPQSAGTIIPSGNPELNLMLNCQYNFDHDQAICKLGLEYLHDVVGRWLKLGAYANHSFTEFGSTDHYTQDFGFAQGAVSEKARRQFADLGAVISSSVVNGEWLELGLRIGLAIAYGTDRRTTDILGDVRTIERKPTDVGIAVEGFLRGRIPLHNLASKYLPDVLIDLNGGYMDGIGAYTGGAVGLDFMPYIVDAQQRERGERGRK